MHINVVLEKMHYLKTKMETPLKKPKEIDKIMSTMQKL